MSASYVEGASSQKDCNGNHLSLIYFNALRLVAKFDQLCLVVSAQKPDIVAIVESWLCPDISDNEICIAGYNVFRKDRNRHGGGVLLYIRDHLTAEVLPSYQSSNLEFLLIVIRHLGFKFCVSVFYRPPNSPILIFDTLFSALASLNISVFSHFVLLGDFSVNMNDTSHHLYHKVHSLLNYFKFTQVVSDFTYTAPCGTTSLINPRRTCAGGVVVCVSVCLCVCLSVCSHDRRSLVHLRVQSKVPTTCTRCSVGFQFVDFARSISFESYGIICLIEEHSTRAVFWKSSVGAKTDRRKALVGLGISECEARSCPARPWFRFSSKLFRHFHRSAFSHFHFHFHRSFHHFSFPFPSFLINF